MTIQGYLGLSRFKTELSQIGSAVSNIIETNVDLWKLMMISFMRNYGRDFWVQEWFLTIKSLYSL